MEIFEIQPSLRLYIIPIAILQRRDDTIRFYFFPPSPPVTKIYGTSLKKKKKNIENETFLSLFSTLNRRKLHLLKPVGRSWKNIIYAFY